MPELSWSKAYRLLRDDPAKAADVNVWIQFLKDWVKAPRETASGR